GVRMVLPWICSRPNREEAVDTRVVGQTASDAKKIGVQRALPLVIAMDVASCRIRLPDLKQRVRYGRAEFIEDTAGHDDALADSLVAGPSVVGEIGVLRSDRADGWTWPSELRERERDVNEPQGRGALDGRAIRFVEIGREDLAVAAYDRFNRGVH